MRSLPKPLNKPMLGLLVAATAITGAIAFYGISQFKTVDIDTSQPAEIKPIVKRVTALGRLEPAGEIIQLSAPLALDGDRVAQLLVKEGDRVSTGQIIAVLDSRDVLQDELRQAQQQVKAAQAKADQVKAGAKTGEIQAQQATISQLEAELNGSIATQNAAIARWQSEVSNARAEYNRYQQLYQQGAIAASNLDSKRLVAQTAQAQLNEAIATKNKTLQSLQAQIIEAKATLNEIAQVRPVDVQAAETEVQAAIAAVKRAETALEQAYIRAPLTGQILKIHTRTGEKLTDNGIADLAQTDQMLVVAEVYQTDIGKVQLGQQAVITSQAFAGEVKGRVSQIGLQINRQNVFSNQPGENLDRRVVEVKISLNPKDSKLVAGLTNLQVVTAIQL